MPDVWHCCTTLLIRIFLRALTAKVNICGNAKVAHSVQRILATALATYISTLRLAYLCAFIFISLNASDVFVRRKCLFALAWLYELLINRQRDVNVKRFLLTRACGAFFVARPATLSAISPNKPHRQPRTSGPPTICNFILYTHMPHYYSRYSLFGCRPPVIQRASQVDHANRRAAPHKLIATHSNQHQRRAYTASSFAANLAIAAAAVIAFLFFVVADCICKFMTACFGIKGARSYTTCFPQLNSTSIPPRNVYGPRRSSANCFNASQHTQVIKFLSTLAQMCIGMLVALCGLHIPVLKRVREGLN